jgi:hypothetical protein
MAYSWVEVADKLKNYVFGSASHNKLNNNDHYLKQQLEIVVDPGATSAKDGSIPETALAVDNVPQNQKILMVRAGGLHWDAPHKNRAYWIGRR